MNFEGRDCPWCLARTRDGEVHDACKRVILDTFYDVVNNYFPDFAIDVIDDEALEGQTLAEWMREEGARRAGKISGVA